MEFDELRQGQLGIIVTEAARNIAAHAGQGVILLSAWTHGKKVGIDMLAQIGRANGNDSSQRRHYFHRMAVMVVPLPGVVSISNSLIKRLLPLSPRPIPDPVLYPSFNANAISAMPGP